MKTDHRRKYIFYPQAFENAKWILTNKKSGEVSEHDYSGMSSIVIEGYRSRNSRFAATYGKKEAKPPNVIIRYLHRVSCLIYSEGSVEDVSYSQILPDYTIDCYDWHYLCRHCDAVLDEIREKGQETANRVFCPHCFEESEYR